MAFTFNLCDYWDFASKPGQAYVAKWYNQNGDFCFANANAYSSQYGGCTAQATFSDAAMTKQQDGWFYKDDPWRGMLEVADLSGWKRMVYVYGREIPWGGHLETIGTTKSWTVQIDYSKSLTFPFWRGYWSYASQTVEYVEHFDTWTDCLGRVHEDVILIRNAQPWGKSNPNDHSNSACFYYLKKGVGRIGVVWCTYAADGFTIISQQPLQCAVYTGSISLTRS